MGTHFPACDSFGRRFSYLRLSVTDVCNFKCSYCLPDGYQKGPRHDFLSADEISHLVAALAQLGLWKVRLTGGEPTVRKDLPDLIRRIAATPGVRHVALTTNGYRLRHDLAAYRAAGLSSVNVSVDSLDPKRFQRVTGHDCLPTVLEGVTAALASGMEAVKLNAVLLRETAAQELPDFLSYVQHRPLVFRFIELMQTADNQDYFARQHSPAATMIAQLVGAGWRLVTRLEGAGPAVTYSHPDYAGRIGFITPYAKEFCQGCNRLRVSARGSLQLCLFGQGGHDLRPLLQSPAQCGYLKDAIIAALQYKPVGHALQDGNVGDRHTLASIGG